VILGDMAFLFLMIEDNIDVVTIPRVYPALLQSHRRLRVHLSFFPMNEKNQQIRLVNESANFTH